jgi:hypothetical protein
MSRSREEHRGSIIGAVMVTGAAGLMEERVYASSRTSSGQL